MICPRFQLKICFQGEGMQLNNYFTYPVIIFGIRRCDLRNFKHL